MHVEMDEKARFGN